MKPLSVLFVVMLAGLFLAGCAEEEPDVAPPPPTDAAPKKLPNDRVLNDFYRKSGVNEPLPDDPDALITDSIAQRLIQSVDDLQRAAKRAEQPDVVIDTAANLVGDKIKEAETKKLWSFVLPLVEAYQKLRPNDKIYQSYAQRAQSQLTRPKVALRGLYYDHTSGMTTASLKVFNPITRETTTENVRMGEEFAGIKFTKVIGKDEGIEMEMQSTGTVFQVMKGEDLK